MSAPAAAVVVVVVVVVVVLVVVAVARMSAPLLPTLCDYLHLDYDSLFFCLKQTSHDHRVSPRYNQTYRGRVPAG